MPGPETRVSSSWGVLIARLHKLGSLHIQEALKPWGLGTGLHPYVLALEAGPLHQEALSQVLWVDKANTARAVAKLEALGLVVRQGIGSDKRLKQVKLSPAGISLLEPIKKALLSWELILRAELTPEELVLYEKLFNRLEQSFQNQRES